MPKIYYCEQGSEEWARLRLGRVTASEMGDIMTNSFEARKGDGVQTYMAKKIAEKWYGNPLPDPSSWAMDQGQILETQARTFFELEHNAEVEQVGFIESDDLRCGASPDGLVGIDAGIEIKCPLLKTHVRYLLEGGIPKDYICQVHGSLYVTGRKRWHFLSYYRKFPPLLVTVERDEAIMLKIDVALKTFYAAFDAAFIKISSY